MKVTDEDMDLFVLQIARLRVNHEKTCPVCAKRMVRERRVLPAPMVAMLQEDMDRELTSEERELVQRGVQLAAAIGQAYAIGMNFVEKMGRLPDLITEDHACGDESDAEMSDPAARALAGLGGQRAEA